MEFATPRRRRAAEPIVPMINVVFLLLIFFLMSAQIAPPAPFDVILPESGAGDRAAPADTLYMDEGGRLAFNAARGEAVLGALAARATPDAPLQIRADAGLEARALARLLPELAARGVERVEIVTGAK
ncbi:MAG: biopolymer transporter ExbD [Alphaproteobacteria bacterium HGW-Alphaproteobacteria-1]|jgi:biopolymer transport protein ExbD|nr:MAG: biopolymer transporter ExbD [Alphaproteobacteria bacterium HGW-Alphaproteobacteria-1]